MKGTGEEVRYVGRQTHSVDPYNSVRNVDDYGTELKVDFRNKYIYILKYLNNHCPDLLFIYYLFIIMEIELFYKIYLTQD